MSPHPCASPEHPSDCFRERPRDGSLHLTPLGSSAVVTPLLGTKARAGHSRADGHVPVDPRPTLMLAAFPPL